MAFASYSPFASALFPKQFFQYDADGDAIMTDAATGLPITYGTRVRARSASLEAENTDDRASKRSRSSSEETRVASPFGALSPIRIPSAERNLNVLAVSPPPAPKKAARSPREDEEEEEEEDAIRPLRNIAEELTAALLADVSPRGEPLVDVAAAGAMAWPEAELPPPAGDDGAPAAADEWCASVTCSDLALRLDMRHPRVVLNLLRFVSTYNELAPEDEDIHLPLLPQNVVDMILNHESVVNPVPEFAADVAELRALVNRFAAPPEEEDDRRGYDPYEDRSDPFDPEAAREVYNY